MITKAQLDVMTPEVLYDLPIDTEVEGFAKADWKSVWVQAIELWAEDGGWWYNTVTGGFKGFSERTDVEVYLDLRFTYIDGQDRSWDELWDENNEMGKYS